MSLAAVFVLLATTILRENLAAARFGWVAAVGVVLCGFTAKIGFEYLTGQTVFVDSTAAQMVPIPLAHVVGWWGREQACAAGRLEIALRNGPLSKLDDFVSVQQCRWLV